MHIEQVQYTRKAWSPSTGATPSAPSSAQLVLVFGGRTQLQNDEWLPWLRERYPTARIVSCSSGGEVAGGTATDGVVATAVTFDHTTVQVAEVAFSDADASESAGRELAEQLSSGELAHVLVFAEGLAVNGSALAKGIASALPQGVTVTGGLAADGEQFEETAVGVDAPPSGGRAVAIGLYGPRLRVRIGSEGGWLPFGTPMRITRSRGSTLHELDGRPALAVYRELLGPLGYGLPASGLFFPLSIQITAGAPPVIRTILGIDEAAQTVRFAGDVPEGCEVTLVNSTLDALIDAAGLAATHAAGGAGPQLGIAVSCIGRKLLLQRRTGEELSRVQKVLGPRTTLCGFYSYGELAPAAHAAPCELHNQTMTLTVLSEQ